MGLRQTRDMDMGTVMGMDMGMVMGMVIPKDIM